MEMDKSVELVMYGMVLMFLLGSVFFVVYTWTLASDKKEKK